MGRKPRILYSGGLYHVIQRGNNRKYIFDCDEDKSHFMQLLERTKSKYPFSLLYFVIMDNHFHLLIETTDVALDVIVKYLTMMYSKEYNRKYKRTGTLYEGRYTASLVTDQRYFLQLIKYIAYNPVRAKIAKSPDDYRWSAHFGIKWGKPGLLNVQTVLSYFDNNGESSLRSYIAFVETPKVENDNRRLYSTDKRREQALTALEALFIDRVPEVTMQTRILNKERTQAVSALRKSFAVQAFQGGFLMNDIAVFLGLAPYSVRCLIKGELVE